MILRHQFAQHLIDVPVVTPAITPYVDNHALHVGIIVQKVFIILKSQLHVVTGAFMIIKQKNAESKVDNIPVEHSGKNTHIGIMLNSVSGAHKKLWELFSKYCRKHNMLLMTRFAEAQDEMEWLEHGFSDIDLLHKFMGFRKITPYKRMEDPVEYLDGLKVLTKKVIVANANYVSDNQLEELAETGVKFVYQPRYSDEICNKKPLIRVG